MCQSATTPAGTGGGGGGGGGGGDDVVGGGGGAGWTSSRKAIFTRGPVSRNGQEPGVAVAGTVIAVAKRPRRSEPIVARMPIHWTRKRARRANPMPCRRSVAPGTRSA